MKVKKSFSMVEVALAIAIVGIGIAGVMALFPVGFNATRDAIGDSYAADAADVFLTYLASEAQKDADWTASGGGPNIIVNLPTSRPDKSGGGGQIDNTDPDVSTWTDCGNGIYAHKTAGVLDGVFRVYQGSNTVYDFQAGVRVWKSQIEKMNIAGAEVDIPYTHAARLNVEISWPVQKQYDTDDTNVIPNRREIRFYCLEVFKQEN